MFSLFTGGCQCCFNLTFLIVNNCNFLYVNFSMSMDELNDDDDDEDE